MADDDDPYYIDSNAYCDIPQVGKGRKHFDPSYRYHSQLNDNEDSQGRKIGFRKRGMMYTIQRKMGRDFGDGHLKE